MFFKRHSIQMKFVKDPEAPEMDIPEMPKFDMPSKEDVIDVTNELIKNTAIAVISIIGASALAKTLSEIAIHHGTKK